MDFRKIDVDKYDEDVVTDADLYDPDPRSPQEVLSIARQKTTEVRSLVGRGDAKGALSLALDSPPYGPDAEEAKTATLQTLLDVFNSTKSSDIAALVKALSISEQDDLMKYIYKGLAAPEMGTSALLLSWHEKLTEVAGTGCIVRVMSDRRAV